MLHPVIEVKLDKQLYEECEEYFSTDTMYDIESRDPELDILYFSRHEFWKFVFDELRFG